MTEESGGQRRRRVGEVESMPVPEHDGWRARDGFSIVVADRGAVRFDLPTGWVTAIGPDGDLHVTDDGPPHDEISLKLTVLRSSLPGSSCDEAWRSGSRTT